MFPSWNGAFLELFINVILNFELGGRGRRRGTPCTLWWVHPNIKNNVEKEMKTRCDALNCKTEENKSVDFHCDLKNKQHFEKWTSYVKKIKHAISAYFGHFEWDKKLLSFCGQPYHFSYTQGISFKD